MDFYHLIVRKLISPEIWVSRQAISEDNQYNQYNSGKVKSGLVFTIRTGWMRTGQEDGSRKDWLRQNKSSDKWINVDVYGIFQVKANVING